MRQLQKWSGILIGSALVALSVQPVGAAATPVTAVRLNPTKNGIELILETQTGDRPQVFTISRGNDTMANLLNAQLNLPSGGSFRQDNPMPGIKSVVVSQVGDKSVQVVVSGAASPPKGEILQGGSKQITLSFSPNPANQVAQGSTASQTPAALGLPTTTAQIPPGGNQPPTTPPPLTPGQTPIPQIPPAAPTTPTGQTPTPQATPALPRPEVLFPNPDITVDGKPAPPAGAVQPIAPAPPFLPRAVAPPVGDIGVANIDSSASVIDLGTAIRVPRLVLREAPVREVLSLLARSAGLNLAFSGAGAGGPGAPPGATGGAAGAGGPTISLDIENEPVQDVFNYVLQISGLQANRQGRTIFVGSQLPQGARDIITRSFRLNQVAASAAAGFLSAQGAETQRVVEQVQIQTVGEGAAARTVETRNITVQPLAATVGTGPLLLRGLSVLTDERLNAVTLVGAPRQIEIASSFLTQLDARRRQVAVNIKVVDVNLAGADIFNSSFSFGVGNGFFVNDNGAAAFNFGGFNPPTRTTLTTSPVTPPVIANPFAGATVFVDPSRTITVQGTTPGTTVINNGNVSPGQTGAGLFPQPFVNLTNPLQAGLTNITPATNNLVTFQTTGNPPTTTVTTTAGTNGTVTTALPSVFQFPKKFLSLLQAQITSNNAKILTDPTLIVQEGQSANVNLTQEVVGNITNNVVSTPSSTTQTITANKERVGLTINVRIDRIDDNGFVSLSVAPVVRAPGAPAVIPVSGGGSQTIFLVNERSLNSGLIRLRDAQTLILTGIIQESDTTTVSKIPILGDIPIIGALFRSTNRTNQRQEVIVLLTPQIIDDSSRATFGYNYSPGPDTRQLLQRQGFPVQGGNR